MKYQSLPAGTNMTEECRLSNYDQILIGAAKVIFEHLGIGILVVDQNYRIELSNMIGERWLSDKEIFCIKSNTLYIRDSNYQNSVDKALSSAADKRFFTDEPTDAELYLEFKDGRRFSVEILPFCHSEEMQGDAQSAAKALVLVRDVDPGLQERAAAFQEKHLLTKTEMEIIRFLVRGLSPDAVSKRRHRSIKTIRAQMRTIFSKTNCHKVGELIASFNQS